MKAYRILFDITKDTTHSTKNTKEKIHPKEFIMDKIHLKVYKINYTYSIIRGKSRKDKLGEKYLVLCGHVPDVDTNAYFNKWVFRFNLKRPSVKQIYSPEITEVTCIGNLLFDPDKNTRIPEKETWDKLSTFKKFITICIADEEFKNEILSLNEMQFLNTETELIFKLWRAKYSFDTKDNNTKWKNKYVLSPYEVERNDIKAKYEKHVDEEKYRNKLSNVDILEVLCDGVLSILKSKPIF